MASSPTAFPPVSGGAFSAEDRRAAATWHGAWVAAVATGAALMLIGLGSAPWRTLLALALGAAPGLLGVLWRPRTLAQRAWVLLAWAGAAGSARAVTGGIGGPLAVWGLTPVLASLAYGGLWRQGAARAFAALAAVAVIQAAGRLALPPTGGLGLWLGLTALGTSLGLGAAAVMMRADARREAAAAGPGSAATTSLPASPDPTAPAAATAAGESLEAGRGWGAAAVLAAACWGERVRPSSRSRGGLWKVKSCSAERSANSRASVSRSRLLWSWKRVSPVPGL